jgi:hypothetical protein
VGLTDVVECLAERADIDPQVRLLDEGPGPDYRDQLLLGDHFPGAGYEGDEDVQGAAADPNRLAVAQQQALRTVERERTEPET